jgi:hypothetical protein
MTAVHGYVLAFGCPVAFYSDKHVVFRVNKPNAAGGAGMTQLGRALAELNIEIICANSSQAKGRVERVNRTLQDRLVKELRLANICDISAGNTFLPVFMTQFNERFAIASARPEDMHRPLSMPVDKLTDILCHREQRYVGSQLTLSYDRKRIILERNTLSEDLRPSMLTFTTSQMAAWKSAPRASCFPIASSARIRGSAIPRSSRTSDWATPLPSSRPSKTRPSRRR